MSPRIVLLLAIIVIVLIIVLAGPNTPRQPARPADAAALASGAHMYGTYCAGCHGADGKGNGSTARALKAVPPDLTTLARRNRGTYPGGNVFQAIKWGGGVYRPRSGVMPVWGAELKQVSDNDDARLTARIMDLTSHLERLQVQ